MTPSPSPTETTSGWRLVYIGAEDVVASLGGVDPWKRKWRSVSPTSIVVAHPSFQAQRHDFRVYEMNGSTGPVRFAAGEVSNGVWGIFVPESNRSDAGGSR